MIVLKKMFVSHTDPVSYHADWFDESVNSLLVKKPYKPELEDLYRLFQMVILNRRTTILEFGCGWSSLIFSMALSELKKKYNINNLRRNNPFELHCVEVSTGHGWHSSRGPV